MIGSLLLIAVATQAAPVPQRDVPIIVTGRRLGDLQAALAVCLARQCPPNEDIDATLAVAEKQFLDGDYQGARRTVAASVGRNNRYAAAFPVPVSDLQRSYGRIAAHLGEPKIYRFATHAAVRALKRGLDRNDRRVIAAEIEAGDMQARTRAIDSARLTYRRVANRAREHDLPMLVGAALVRIVLLGGTEVFGSEAREALAELSADPKLAPFAVAVKLVDARRAAHRGDTGAIDRLIATLPRNPGARPMLVYAPRLDFSLAGTTGVNDGLIPINVDDVGQPGAVVDQWIDIGFWVTPEGRVSDAEILRASPRLAGNWSDAVLTAVRGRRYTPVATTLGDPGRFRVERHTYTADLVALTGTRIRVRSGNAKVEILDLTNDLPAEKS